MDLNIDRRISYFIIALTATLFFMVAIGHSGWQCGGSILSSTCIKSKVFQITGALLLTAGLLIFAAAIFILLVALKAFDWAGYVAVGASFTAAILATAGVFYYFDVVKLWSPFLATIAMSLTVALSGMLLVDVINHKKR